MHSQLHSIVHTNTHAHTWTNTRTHMAKHRQTHVPAKAIDPPISINDIKEAAGLMPRWYASDMILSDAVSRMGMHS